MNLSYPEEMSDHIKSYRRGLARQGGHCDSWPYFDFDPVRKS